ncbi:MAG: DUF6968 family protein [Gemmatimonadaceae bacterium]
MSEHTTTHWIAATRFVAVHPDGVRTIVRVAIAAPEPAGKGAWRCAVSLSGLYDELAPMEGCDAVQALGLAWQLAGRLLASFEAGGGRLEFQTGERVPLSAYFELCEGPG